MEALIGIIVSSVGIGGLSYWCYLQGKKDQRRECESWQHGDATRRIRQQPWNARHGSN